MYKLTGIVLIVLLTGASACGQTAEQSPQSSLPPKVTSPEAPRPAQSVDPARQMQLDLDQMESMVNNMAAQVSFIRDTNMSILLNTNVRLWSVLIHDLRLQLQEQQRHAASGKSN